MSRRFRIRSLFVLILVLCTALAAYRAAVVRHRFESEVIQSLSGQRFLFTWKRHVPIYASCLPPSIRDKFGRVIRANISGGFDEDTGWHLDPKEFTDEELPLLLKLKHIEQLSLVGSSVSGDGLQSLSKLKRLRGMNLSQTTQISPNDQERFRLSNPNCRICTNHGAVDVLFWPPDEVRVQYVPIKIEDFRTKIGIRSGRCESSWPWQHRHLRAPRLRTPRIAEFRLSRICSTREKDSSQSWVPSNVCVRNRWQADVEYYDLKLRKRLARYKKTGEAKCSSCRSYVRELQLGTTQLVASSMDVASRFGPPSDARSRQMSPQ